MYGNRILYRIATDHQADERRLAAEARRADAVDGDAGKPQPEVAGRAGRRPSGHRSRLPRLGWIRRHLGASGA